MANITYKDYVVVGNEDEGYLLELSSVDNRTTGYSNDYAKFTDVFSGDVFTTTWTDEGVGTLSVWGKQYDVTLSGSSAGGSDTFGVTLNYPDSTPATDDMVIYPTIQTSKGAKLFFYKPLNISLEAWDGTNDLVDLKLPDGDGYTDVTFSYLGGNLDTWTLSGDALTTAILNTSVTEGLVATIGQLKYNITGAGTNYTMVYLMEADDVTEITRPALAMFEGKDDNSAYEALIVKLEADPSGDADDGIGIADVERTWGNDLTWDSLSSPSDSKIKKEADLYGTIVTTDESDSDQKSAEISYPSEQMYVQLYMGEEDSSVVAGTSGTTSSTPLGEVLVMDSEVSSVSSKNLIIVGGSCINSAAATVLGGAYCGAAFTDATGVGSGQFLIQGFDGAYTAGKLALVVAGYEAADTVNAATYLKTKTVDTMKKYIGTSATSAEMVVETA
jgi:hypothetical protein